MQTHHTTKRSFTKASIASALTLCTSVAIANDNGNGNGNGNGNELEHIEVQGQWQAYRGNVPLAKTPQAIDSISREALDVAGITRFHEALDFSPSIVKQNSSGGMWDSFAIRGFAGDENNAAGYLVNGFNVGRGYNGRRSTANIELVEVMKGPGSALYGQGEPGGTINIITKKPKFSPQGYIQAGIGNFNTKQFEFDYTDALNKEVAYRLNGAYEDSDTHRDFVYFKSLNLHPSLLWNISEHTSVSYELEILDQKKPFDRGIFILGNNFDGADTTAFYGDIKDGPHRVKALGHQLSLSHRMANQWHLLAGLAYRDSSFKGHSSDAELSGGRQLIYKDPNHLSRQRRERDYQGDDLTTRLELSGDSQLFGVKNNLLIGLDYYDYHVDTRLYRWRTRWGSGDATYSINPNKPNYDQSQPATSVQTKQKEDQSAFGLYVQDLLELNSNTTLLAGVRIDKFKQEIYDFTRSRAQDQNKSAVSPRLGLVYKLNDTLSLYTNYAEGFRPNPGLDSNGNAFNPEESQSFEVGAKWDSASTGFSVSIALYDAEKSNILTADPINSDFSATLGKANSRGLELDFNQYLTANTNLELSYAYTDAKTANETTNPDWGIVIPKGARLINIAKHKGYVSVKHFTTINQLETFFGITGSYVGKRLGETIDPNYVLPGYSLIDLFASVQVNEQLSFQFDLNNVFDKEYFESSYHKLWTMPGASRHYRLTLKYQF